MLLFFVIHKIEVMEENHLDERKVNQILWIFITLMVGMQNGTVMLENHLAVSYIVNLNLTHDPAILLLGIPKGWNFYPNKNL